MSKVNELHRKKTCCIVMAAGLSSRMGRYKPLLPIDGQPAIVHLLSTVFDAGVDHCVIVTGHRADDLKAACCGLNNITFVHNPSYATTDMFTSAKIGFRAVTADYSRILFTPADIPLIPVTVIQGLLKRPEPLIYPCFQHKKGHPVSIDASILGDILKFDGDDGLRGALASLPVEPAFLETDDPGILMDMDTPDDYRKILRTLS